MEYIFVACQSRLGSVKLNGPKTGKDWIITRYGNWMAKDDEELLDTQVQVWCFRQNKFITIKAIYETVPSSNQMELMPTN
jgi:hypothetical protein